jgi:hypothetical protein
VAYLDDHPPARTQFRRRYATPTGLIVVHTAESVLDAIGEDTGAEGVADFIRRRADPGSYHRLVDSDSIVALVRFEMAAYGDGTGSNEFAIHLSFACRAADWPGMDPARREAFLVNGARAAREAAAWLREHHSTDVPARRVTRTQSDQGAAGFISHGERDPDRRTDPGPGFPWDRFLHLYALEENDMTPKQATQLADALQAAQAAQANTERIERILDRHNTRRKAQAKRAMDRLDRILALVTDADRDHTALAEDLDALRADIADLIGEDDQ